MNISGYGFGWHNVYFSLHWQSPRDIKPSTQKVEMIGCIRVVAESLGLPEDSAFRWRVMFYELTTWK
jgi:hypothetical protein